MNFLKLVGTLTVVCLLSGLSLSYFYTKTKPNIIKNVTQKELKLKQEIITNAKKFNKVDANNNFLSLEEAVDDKDEVIGLLVKNKTRGYGGDIEYLLGISLDPEPKIINLKVLSHKETPGLGAKVVTPQFLSQYVSKNSLEIYLKKDSPNGKIDSITGATITSRAFTNSVRKVLEDDTLRQVVKEKTFKEENVIEKSKLEKVKQQKVSFDQQSEKFDKYETVHSTKTQEKTQENILQNKENTNLPSQQ